MKNAINKIRFGLWGLAVKYYGFTGRLFKSKTRLDKSVHYMDKRFHMILTLKKGL